MDLTLQLKDGFTRMRTAEMDLERAIAQVLGLAKHGKSADLDAAMEDARTRMSDFMRSQAELSVVLCDVSRHVDDLIRVKV